ncbi:MAG: alpha-amylase, partial [Candidatus Harrisonbacteria bacterium CG10_big_fil_rev_8_21_14_0_10_45_28]
MKNINKDINKNWSRRAVVYQIYPRSFKDTDGDGIGDLKGIIEKLDYLNYGTDGSLGITAIWLNPIYKSPMKDFGYDISDYRDIDPIFGDLGIFDRLVAEAHKRGIKIIMDFVPNHTSSEHPWFQESKRAKDNSKRDWYIWRDPKTDGSPPNNWLSIFGGSAWTRDEKTGQYYMHSFLPDQPDLNWRNKDVRDEMADVLRFWLKRGVDGFRTDAMYHLIKDDEFRDDPPNPNYDALRDEPYNAFLHVYSQGRPELTETANTLCNVLGEHSDDIYMVSEAYLGLPQMMEFYKACDNSL